MAKPYSQDLRDRVIDAVKRGEMSRRAAARRYAISESVAIKWLERVERDGSREPVGHGGHRASKLMPHRDFLKGRAGREIGRHASGPLRSPFGRARGQGRHLDDEPLFSPDRRHAQKKTLVAREQDRPDISRHRKRWRTYQGLIDPRRLIFIDETWTKTNMTRLRGWAPRGERLVDKVPQGKWKTATFLAALRNDRIDAPCLFDGPINGERFHAYVEQFLVPTLKPGDVVILDNLGSHKGKAVRRAIREPMSSSSSCRR
jgi:DDE superfamily endonuclease